MPLYMGTKYIGSTVMPSSVETGLTMEHIVQEAGQSETLVMSQKAVTDYVNFKTPQKGTDYFTAADKAEMVNAVIAALPDASEVNY